MNCYPWKYSDNLPVFALVMLTLFLASCAQIKTDIPEKPESPGYLGALLTAQQIKDKTLAVALPRITAVLPGSAAETAGLRIGDLLVELDDTSLEKPSAEVLNHFIQLIRGKGAGTKLTLRVRRNTVTSQTFIDNTLQPSDLDRITGDPKYLLNRLLDESPEQLIEIRTRARKQDQEIDVVLTAHDRAAEQSLPDNSTLNPELEAQSLLPVAALAERIIGIAQSDRGPILDQFNLLINRFETDQRTDDPFRLRSTRYLHRNPLKLPNATRGLGKALRSVQGGHEKGLDLSLMMDIVRRHLDTPTGTSNDLMLPARPTAGATAIEHGHYLLALIKLAEQYVAKAFVSLTEAERKLLKDSLPSLADKFAEHLYLYMDDNRLRWQQHAELIEILPKIDRSALLTGSEVLLAAVATDYLTQLSNDLTEFEADPESSSMKVPGVSGGVLWYSGEDIVIGGSGDNEYRSEFSIVVDIGGDDRYRTLVGSARPDRPAALVIDLAGNDRYQSTALFSQGSGFMGVGVLFDQAGDDRYITNQNFAQGSALAGVGLLIDRAGNDLYRGLRYVQGSALCQGFAAVLDGSGDDSFNAGALAQGFAGPGAFGGLFSSGGDDQYLALGLDRSSYPDGVGIYKSLSQGAAVGFRLQSSGGIGVLLDDGGKDHYEAGNFSQGGGYYFGWGLLIDLGVDSDLYEGSRYAQGFASHSALGSFWDEGGDDVYHSWVGASNSAAWDLSATVFLEDGGNDHYAPGSGFAIGASAHNGFSLFVDYEGEDRYQIAPGRAGPNSYHGGPSLSIFIDAGGQTDRYEGTGLSDVQGLIKGDTGVLLDLPVVIKNADEVLLRQLLLTEEHQVFDFNKSD